MLVQHFIEPVVHSLGLSINVKFFQPTGSVGEKGFFLCLLLMIESVILLNSELQEVVWKIYDIYLIMVNIKKAWMIQISVVSSEHLRKNQIMTIEFKNSSKFQTVVHFTNGYLQNIHTFNF